MLRYFAAFIVSAALYGAELADIKITTSYGSKLRAPRAANVPEKSSGGRRITVFPGDDVLPQVANGAGWRTQIVLVNLSTVRLPFSLDFWTSDGGFWQIPVIGVGTGDQITGTLAPGATTVFETSGQGALAQGWAELTYDSDAGSIGGFGVFRQSVAGRPDQEAVAQLTSLFDKTVVLPFDNTSGFVTGIACVNGGRVTPSTITAIIYDQSGLALGTESVQLQASAQTAFALPTRFPSTQGRRGTIVFRSNTNFFSVLGLRFNPSGAFTSFSGMNTIDMLR